MKESKKKELKAKGKDRKHVKFYIPRLAIFISSLAIYIPRLGILLLSRH